nr:MAG TPA: hypothetical protein [Caudoviricetes sp.]DAM74969.1 MAG TPA: hypothetical protein [Caudoviricetes sp.]
MLTRFGDNAIMKSDEIGGEGRCLCRYEAAVWP